LRSETARSDNGVLLIGLEELYGRTVPTRRRK